jgi:hypothetical protein
MKVIARAPKATPKWTHNKMQNKQSKHNNAQLKNKMKSTFTQSKEDKKITMMLHNLQTTMTHTTKPKINK